MSDVVIVSRDEFRNAGANPNTVRYGAILDDDQDVTDPQYWEGMQDGAVAAVDWRGIDQVDTPIGPPKRKPGRPKKVK